MEPEALRGTPWHTQAAGATAEALEVDPGSGLSEEAASDRLDRHGPNAIRSGEIEPWWRVLVRQFLDPLIYVLIVAGLVTLALEDYVDAAVILAVVLLNGGIGFVQELRARNAISALAEMSAPRAVVRRGGRRHEIDTEKVVPGDVVLLASGARVPADVRLVRADDLRIDESALTGESDPVLKQTDPVEGEDAVPGDQLSMAFAGTSVVRGRGVGVVVHTGEASQLGRIAEKVQSVGKVRTPIQEKMDRLGHAIGAGIVALAGLVAVVGVVRGMSTAEIVQTAVALAVGAVPEALPVVLTVALAVGVRRMARRNAVIRTLPSVETLGSTTVIGSDKTGTLTSNRMTVQAIWAGGRTYRASESDVGFVAEGGSATSDQEDASLRATVLAGVLANETEGLPGPDEERRGDPTELALLEAAARAGLDPGEARGEWERIDLIPFESERRYMASLHRGAEGARIFLKGAPEAVVERCSRQLGVSGEAEPLDRDAALEAAHTLAEEGYRVLGMAFAEAGGESLGEDVEGGLVLAGFQGLEDPLRPEALAAVEAAHAAGIRVLMLTGDHADTARAIGRQLGLAGGEGSAREGRELDALSDDELDAVVREVDVFARVSPDHKLRLVERLKAQGEIVAVTGDGVNDAPALRAAHLGVAMGQAGTDVAREASDMVLTDDNFASITSAVEEGRLVFANIRKVTYFLLSTGLALVLTILFSLFAGWPLPYLPVQVLWINLVTNGLQDVALAFEKAEPGLLDEPPRDPREGVINREVLYRLLWVGAFITVATMAVFWWMLQQTASLELARSTAMTQMVMFQFFHVFNSRSLRRSVLQVPLTANPFLAVSLALAMTAQLAVLYVPFLQGVFGTTPLPPAHWALVVAVGSTIVMAAELDKAYLRARDRRARARARVAETD
jgi:calcium-translocating P-type ATPase